MEARWPKVGMQAEAVRLARKYDGAAFVLVLGPRGSLHCALSSSDEEALRLPDLLRQMAEDMEQKQAPLRARLGPRPM